MRIENRYRFFGKIQSDFILNNSDEKVNEKIFLY